MKAHKSNMAPAKLTKRQPASKLKIVSKTSAGANTALEVYLQSLAPSGRKAMKSLLSTASNIMMADQPGATVWHKINYQQIQRVRAVMIEQGRAMNTVNLTLAGMLGVARAAYNLGFMQLETWTRLQAIKRVKGTTLPKGRSLTAQEIKAMADVCNRRKSGVRGVRDKALLMVGCWAGLRCKEITGLRVNDFDLNTGALRVMKAKGNKQREIYLTADAVGALSEWIKVLPPEGSRLVFRKISKGGKISDGGLTEWGIAIILRELQVKAGVEPFKPHDLRRSFITWLLQKDVDLNLIRKLVGHEDITTTARYDRRGEIELKQASMRINQ